MILLCADSSDMLSVQALMLPANAGNVLRRGAATRRARAAAGRAWPGARRAPGSPPDGALALLPASSRCGRPAGDTGRPGPRVQDR